MKKYSLIPVMLLFSSLLFGQGIYNNGGKIVIGTGVSVTVSGTSGNFLNTTNVTDGSVDLSGTLALAGNFTNNAVADVLNPAVTSGTVVLSGTTSQTIGGSSASGFTLPNLTVNNPAGIVISKNAIVNGTMTFTSGLVNIGNNNFTFGPTASVAGTPSATSMIIATGTGQVQKNWTANGTFTYPVGDNNGSAKYSPVTLTFTGGTYAGAYAGVNLANAKYNDPLITGSYLNRYWNITSTGITAFTCNAILQYVPADVAGTESIINTLRMLPTPVTAYNATNSSLHQLSATGLTAFGTFTGASPVFNLAAKVFLEGPFNNGTTAMNTTLNAGNLIPLAQPYNAAPWNYAGTESVTSIPAGVVDWVLVELRDAATPALALSGTTLTGWPKAFFLKTDGSVVALDGTNQPYIGNPVVTGNLYVIIRHRNHLAVMSGTGATLNTGIYGYDFTTALTQSYGAGIGYKQIATGLYGMVVGDINHDGNIFVTDYNVWAVQFGLANTYSNSDLNQDGSVFVTDYNKWAVNFGNTTINPTLLKSGELKPRYVSCVPQ